MTRPGLWLDRQGNPIDIATAERLLGDVTYKRVARTSIISASDPGVHYHVSTVWLGVDKRLMGCRSRELFETMVFGGPDGDEPCVRYDNEDEAKAGHAEMVATVAATVTDEVITDLTGTEPDAAGR